MCASGVEGTNGIALYVFDGEMWDHPEVVVVVVMIMVIVRCIGVMVMVIVNTAELELVG